MGIVGAAQPDSSTATRVLALLATGLVIVLLWQQTVNQRVQLAHAKHAFLSAGGNASDAYQGTWRGIAPTLRPPYPPPSPTSDATSPEQSSSPYNPVAPRSTAADPRADPFPTVHASPEPWSVPSNEELERRHGRPDPSHECTHDVRRFYQDSFIRGYDISNPDFIRRLDRLKVDWVLKDWGCFTGYSFHGAGILWTVLTAEPFNSYLRLTLGIDPVTGRSPDVTSSKLMYNYHAHHDFHDTRLIGLLAPLQWTLHYQHGVKVAGLLNQTQAPLGERPRPHLDGDERYDVNAVNQLGALTVLDEPVFIVAMQHEKFIGQAYQLFINTLARYWATGAMLEGNATLVMPEPRTPTMRTALAWIEPLLPKPIYWVGMSQVIWAKHAHFSSPSGYEHPDPCTRYFVGRWLLPKALKHVRADPTFKYGDESKRADKRVNDMQWGATLPSKIFMVKSCGMTRDCQRILLLDEKLKGLLQQEGFVQVEDSLPILHRLVLINFAEVAALSFGALLAMMTQVYSRDDLPPEKRLRVVSLVGQWYEDEMYMYASINLRDGMQDGTRVMVVNNGMFSPRGMYFKHVIFKGTDTISHVLTANHLRFTYDDCWLRNRTNPDADIDFPSRYVDRNPRGDNRVWQDPPRLTDLPVVGKCFQTGKWTGEDLR
jgi:hypothetical protein